MGRTLDPAMPTSSSDDELAFRFSGFFSEKVIHIIGAKLMRLLLIRSSL